MSTKKMLLLVLTVALLLAAVAGPRLAGPAQALPPVEQPNAAGVTIAYPGRLTNAAGLPVTDGAYDFTFALYATPSDGEPLWTETQAGVLVQGGSFTTLLGRVHSIPADLLAGSEHWLAVGVRGPGESDFTTLDPRQRLSTTTPAAPAIHTSAPACPHEHRGETWTGSGALTVRTTSTPGVGLAGVHVGTGNYGELGVYDLGIHAVAFGPGHNALYAQSTSGDGVVGEAAAANKSGVYGYSTNGFGVTGRSTNNHAVQGFANWGVGVYAHSDHLAGVFAHSGDGVGLSVTCDTADIIRAFGATGSPDIEFKVTNNGEVYADGSFHSGGADLAEMLPAVETLEPGDVLVIGLDGKLTRSTAAYQPAVAGVYSTKPGFVGGSGDDVDLTGKVPLTVVGVVPVKASAENGPIIPGDLLAASSTPGHAMKASPITINGVTFYPSGVIIGKALQGLDKGTGVIQVLVTLQ